MKGGTFRRIADGFKRLLGRPTAQHQKRTTSYPDPVITMPHSGPTRSGRRKNDVRPMIRRGNLRYPKPAMGNIGYHDRLVRKFGRRMADEYGRLLNDRKIPMAQRAALLPSMELLATHGDWDWRR